jgi:hypothetical protein
MEKIKCKVCRREYDEKKFKNHILINTKLDEDDKFESLNVKLSHKENLLKTRNNYWMSHPHYAKCCFCGGEVIRKNGRLKCSRCKIIFDRIKKNEKYYVPKIKEQYFKKYKTICDFCGGSAICVEGVIQCKSCGVVYAEMKMLEGWENDKEYMV